MSMVNMGDLERDMRGATEIKTMAEAVQVAAIEEVPAAARMVSDQMTAAIEAIAQETEDTATMLLDKATRLRQLNNQVCGDMAGMLRMALQVKELTKSTKSAYLGVGL